MCTLRFVGVLAAIAIIACTIFPYIPDHRYLGRDEVSPNASYFASFVPNVVERGESLTNYVAHIIQQLHNRENQEEKKRQQQKDREAEQQKRYEEELRRQEQENRRSSRRLHEERERSRKNVTRNTIVGITFYQYRHKLQTKFRWSGGSAVESLCLPDGHRLLLDISVDRKGQNFIVPITRYILVGFWDWMIYLLLILLPLSYILPAHLLQTLLRIFGRGRENPAVAPVDPVAGVKVDVPPEVRVAESWWRRWIPNMQQAGEDVPAEAATVLPPTQASRFTRVARSPLTYVSFLGCVLFIGVCVYLPGQSPSGHSPRASAYYLRPAFQTSVKADGEWETVAEIFSYVFDGALTLEVRFERDDPPPPEAWMILNLWIHRFGGEYFVDWEKTIVTRITEYVTYVGLIVWPISFFIPDGSLDLLLTHFGY